MSPAAIRSSSPVSTWRSPWSSSVRWASSRCATCVITRNLFPRMPRISHGVLLIVLILAHASRAFSQHEHMHMNMAPAQESEHLTLFQSDMRRMTGMMPVDEMGHMHMQGWGWMNMGVVRFGYNRQGGDRGDD